MTPVNQFTYEQIKTVVRSFFPEARVLLFGSRARKDSRSDSDFDLLVIIEKTLPVRDKMSWRSKINKALVETLHLPFDVLLNSQDEVDEKKELPGHVVRWAVKEGVIL